MEQVTRYTPAVIHSGKGHKVEMLAVSPDGFTESILYVKAADHARCVQDVRRMAEMAQRLKGKLVLKNQPGVPASKLMDMLAKDSEYQAAQRVLETWKEGA